jgi:hypothetical protein
MTLKIFSPKDKNSNSDLKYIKIIKKLLFHKIVSIEQTFTHFEQKMAHFTQQLQILYRKLPIV